MVEIYGTSHVAGDSLDLIEEKMAEHEPDIVAVELDLNRLQALQQGGSGDVDSLFLKIVKLFQEKIGEKTGVMPGQEMLHAYEMALESGAEAALIDQDIRITIDRIKSISRKEKVRAAASLVFGGLFSNLDADRIPSDKEVEELLEEFGDEFPEMHEALIEERNFHMAASLDRIQEENPEKKIVAFVGAGHRREIERILSEMSE